jgi:hypothetical protein
MWDPMKTADMLLEHASRHENMIGWQLNWIGDTGSARMSDFVAAF